ncbi:MAG TPA: UDP-forming cellulose synthase catalytic subunit [Azospirillaceae bacterium]|nr:UDP-forming cellulose synthase catalytic subunit [Azospirillaceae bacterium]
MDQRHGPPPRAHRVARGAPLLTTLMLIFGGAIVWLAVQDVGLAAQAWLAAGSLLFLWLLGLGEPKGGLRGLAIVVGVFVTLRYLAWRTQATLPTDTWANMLPGLVLYGAELYGITVHLLGAFLNANPLRRPVRPLPDDPALLPTVDILIPTYNESPDLLETTLAAAVQVRYPADRLRVYLLDDGATAQKLNDPDPVKAEATRSRARALKALCARLGATYRTRERNEHAKAGNLNAALPHTSGDLVAILDSDHVPSADFLEKTVGPFLDDATLALVQTPHFFISPDPIERNLNVFRRMPGESEMFYGAVQHGYDSWNAAYFCGSAAVLRRSHLESVGGLRGETITEDAETALELHARGYSSAYIDEPVVAGLSPETFSSFVTQRSRWAQGMIQLLLLKNPLLRRGLRPMQRLAYLNSCLFWLFPFARVAFLLAPLCYLLLGLEIINCTVSQFAAYAVPHVLGSLLLSHILFGRTRWPLVSELYEVVLSIFLMLPLVSVFLRPRKPVFKVTPKAATLDRDFLSPLAWPFYVLFGILLTAEAWGALRYLHFPLQRDYLSVVLAWNTANLLLLAAALGVISERSQRRAMPRVPRRLPCRLRAGDRVVEAMLVDTSVGGACVQIPATVAATLPATMPLELKVVLSADTPAITLPCMARNRSAEGGLVGLQFIAEDDATARAIVLLCHGDGDVWRDLRDHPRQVRRSVIGGLTFFLGLAARSLARGMAMPFRRNHRPAADSPPALDRPHPTAAE